MAGQQQEEIETIRSRTIEVKLSDADVKRISEKAAAHGLTVGELIENFIGDLVWACPLPPRQSTPPERR